MQVWGQISAVGPFPGLERELGAWSKQAVFLGRSALTSYLRLRERAQCPDPEPVGQATQNHLEGGRLPSAKG